MKFIAAMLLAGSAALTAAGPAARAAEVRAAGSFMVAQGEMLHDEVMAARAAIVAHHMHQAMAHLDRAMAMLGKASMSDAQRTNIMHQLVAARKMAAAGDAKGAMAAIDGAASYMGGGQG